MYKKFYFVYKDMKELYYVVIAVISGLIGWGAMYYLLMGNEDLLIKHFYATETAVHISPHWLRKQMDKWDSSFFLVDLRSEQEYEQDHIKGAVSIPAYKDPDTSAYDDKERILASFEELKTLYPERDIIVYCYSSPCMTGRKIGDFLAKNGIYVKHLGIGWNEWKYDRNWWNHEHEWTKTNVNNYIGTGESTYPKTTSCPIDNEFGC